MLISPVQRWKRMGIFFVSIHVRTIWSVCVYVLEQIPTKTYRVS